jgi:MFS family permease
MRRLSSWGEQLAGNSLFVKDEPVYAVFLLGYFVAFVGFFVQMVGGAWLAWELTHSETWVGLVGFSELFPSLIFGLFASAVADRHNRFNLVVITRILAVAQSAVLFVCVYMGWIDIYLLLGLTFFAGTIIAFGSPPLFGIVPRMVKTENLHSAVSLNVTALNLAYLIGSIIAGYLITSIGIAWLFFWNAVSYIIYLGCLMRIRHVFASAKVKPQNLLMHDVLDGLKYMVGNKGTLWLFLSVAVGEMIYRPVLYLLPAVSATLLDAGARGYTLLVSFAGLGGVCGTLYVVRRRSTAGLSDLVSRSIFILVASLIVIALSRHLVVGMIGALGVALANELRLATVSSLNQLAVPEELRSRVLGTQHLLGRASSAVAVGIMGLLAGAVSVTAALLALAGIGFVFWLWLQSQRPVLRRQFELSG